MFTMLLAKGFSQGGFFDIYLTTCLESVISEIQNLWGPSFFKKHFKFNLHYKNAVKNWEKVFFFWDNCIWIGIIKLSLLRTGYIWLAAQDLICQSERLFLNQLTWQWSMNMPKLLWCWFQQCFGTFTMLLVDGSSKTRLFRHLSDHAFVGRNFANRTFMTVIIFLKVRNIYSTFQKCSKKLKKSLFFFEIIASELVSLNYLY